ncbi:MAG: amidohydrolase, partial [Maricaulaceae bacterium]
MMTTAFRTLLAIGAAAALAFAAQAQDDTEDAAEEEDESWDVAAPPLPTRDIPIDVTEGTWMSLDVSPDGRTIAFDLLGDIYTMPIGGGEATNLSSGMPWEIQPRFSPDGSMIAFISDRAGGNNVWIMNVDGSERRALTSESFRLLNNPTWSPDGRYIAARKHFTTERSAGTGEIWLYHLGGGGGFSLIERPNEDFQKEQGEPIFSADGRYVYYSLNTTPGNQFIYAQDSNTQLFAIRRYEMETGETTTAVSGPGGAVRPTPSPDGRLMAFVRRERTQSMLYVKDLTSGEERRIYADLDQDMQETWGVEGMYPNMDWTPDSRSIVFWSGGGIHRIDVASEEVTDIPFHVADTRPVIDPIRPQVEVAPASFTTTMPRFAAVSPDGDQVVFETLGKLYVLPASGGEARRLTRDNSARRELFPTWSPDGSRIAFVTWDDEDLGSIRTIAAGGGGEALVTDEPGHYRRPRYSPDGATLVFEKGSGGFLTSDLWSETTGVFRVPASGGEMTRVTTSGSEPHFAASNERIFMTAFGGSGGELISVDLNGEARRTHATGELVVSYQVSPAGDHVAFAQNYEAYVMPLTAGPQEISAGRNASALPVTEASGDGAEYFHWSHGGDQLNWSLGPTLFSAQLAEMIPDAPPVPSEDEDGDAEDEDDGYEPPTEGLDLSMTVDADVRRGVLALVGARVVTMADDDAQNDGGVIEDATILIEDNRIAAIGPSAEVEVPAGAETLDLAGRTIIPGLIDAHAHGPYGVDEIIPEQNWSTVAHLALGVTTIHDPSSDASHVFPSAELQRAGMLLAPRIYSTGEVVYGARSPGGYAEIDSLEDAGQHVRRLAAQGA